MVVSTDDLQRRLAEVADRLEALANRLDIVYVRRDVFDAYKELMAAKLDQAKTERDTLATRCQVSEDDRIAKGRLVWAAFISACGSMVVSIVLWTLFHGVK